MTEPRHLRDLEAALGDLGEHISYPPTPDLAARVTVGLRSRPRRGLLSFASGPRAVGLAGGLAVVVLAAAVLAFSPAARRAVAGWLGLPGVRIEFGGLAPRPGDLGAGLQVGARTTLAAARERVGFDVRLPAALGAPDEVYLGHPPATGRVTLLYRTRPGLPAAAETSDVGLLLTQFAGEADVDLVKKVVREGTRVVPVEVGGATGYWISGKPHFVFLRAEGGEVFEDRFRIAGNTLLWHRDGLTLRLESGLSRAAATRVAESIP